MRAFEEQQLRQKPASASPSASLSANQAPEPDQAHGDSFSRTSEEQKLPQKPSPMLPSAGLSASQALKPDQAPDDAFTSTDGSTESSTIIAEHVGSPDEGLTAPSAAIVPPQGNGNPKAEQSSSGSDNAASASGRAETLQISTAPLGQDHDRASAAQGPAQAEDMKPQMSQGTSLSKDSSKEASVHSKQDATQD